MTIDKLKHKALSCALPLVPAIMLNSCNTIESGSYQDQKTYGKTVYTEVMRKSFDYEGPGRNPVIVIHGLLGSKLADRRDGTNIWGQFALTEMLTGNKLARLAHPMQEKKPLSELKSDITPSGLLDKSQIRVLGFSFDYEGYDILVNALSKAGYVPDNRPLPEGKNFYSQFIFYYDWRRDISENAGRLKKFIIEKKRYLQERYAQLYGLENHDIHFDLVAHSMGGLVARYFMRYGGTPLPERELELPRLTWEGAKYIDRVAIIATPNAGYPDTLVELTEGLRLSPAAPAYPKTVIGTFPSYYQMLPNVESNSVRIAGTETPVEYFRLETWQRYNWGLADPRQDEWLKILLPDVSSKEERLRIATDHLDKCLRKARQFKRAMQIPATVPENVAVSLLAGDTIMTSSVLAVDPKTGQVSVAMRDAGDGKVPTMSARLDLRTLENWMPFLVSPIAWSSIVHLPGGHMGIMNSDVFESNLLFLLLSTPTPYQKAHMKHYEAILRKGLSAHADGTAH